MKLTISAIVIVAIVTFPNSNSGQDRVAKVSTATMVRHLVRCPLPRPIGARGKTRVLVTVRPDGSVSQARAKFGHPLARKVVNDAVKSWVFKPFVASKSRRITTGWLWIKVDRPDPKYEFCSGV